MKEGDVVLTAFEQTDGKTKNRPAIVLRVMRPFGDFLICGVSRQLRHRVADFDEVIAPTDSDFASSGLTSTSLIRLGFLALLPADEFLATSVPSHPSGTTDCCVVLPATFRKPLMNEPSPNPAMLRTRPSRSGCKPHVPRARSLSLDRCHPSATL